jgi:hypothetical protein
MPRYALFQANDEKAGTRVAGAGFAALDLCACVPAGPANQWVFQFLEAG